MPPYFRQLLIVTTCGPHLLCLHPAHDRGGGFVVRFRRSAIITGLTALTLALGACSGSAVSSGGGGGGGAPHRGGTLHMLGQSDIFNLDPVSAYYTVSSLIERTFTRQLFSYRNTANFAEQIQPVPDVATVMPTTANGGITDA